MNLEEAKANIGKEVVLDESTKPYKCPLNGTHNFGSNVYGVIECVKNSYVKVRLKVGNRINIMPKHLKIKEQPMQNYKIKVTPETSEEVQKLFFALGYQWRNIRRTLISIGNEYLYTGELRLMSLDSNNADDCKEITLPQLRDLVVLKRNDVGDATHAGKNGQKYYISENCAKEYVYGKWVDKVSRVMPIPLSELHVMGCGNKEITWQDAEQAIKDGKDVQVFVCEWSDIGDVFKNHKFRLAPQRITLNGKFTKEELLKIMGEME